MWKRVFERVGLVDMESIAQTVWSNLLCVERFCLECLTFDQIISLAITQTSKRFAYFFTREPSIEENMKPTSVQRWQTYTMR